ncbi:MAG: hypothetical protein WBV81_08955 [Ignavibacteriaceae bacterium]
MAQKQYLYKGRNFGSEAEYNPLNLILNGSFDIIQLQNHVRKIDKIHYKEGTNNVLRNLGNPFVAIRSYGWNKFVSDELLPINITKKGAQWWPNYQLHLIGGGMTFISMKEWYEFHNYPSPVLMSLSTMVAYHLLNEIVENDSYMGNNVDPIADIYFFDTGGIILFSFKSVRKFFSEVLNLSDWSLQASFLINDFSLQNNGQYFSIKWKLPFSSTFHVFYYFGMNGLLGVSYKFIGDRFISFGAGLRNKELIVVNQNTDKKTADLTWNIGLFYDVQNSLMSSITLSGLTDYKIDINPDLSLGTFF